MSASASALNTRAIAISVAPPAWLEYAFYAQVFYAVMGSALGLSFGSLGAVLLGIVASGCVLSMGRFSIGILQSVAIPVACGLSFFAIQLLIHESSLDSGYVRDWIPWVAGVVALQYLALRRNFLHRASVALFVMGLATLPYVELRGTEHRAGLESTITIANPNDFGAWFGFCGVYFVILGLEVRRHWVRAVAWSLATLCLLLMASSVSRGPLAAAAVGIVFALRRLLKRGFLPLLALAAVAWLAFALGLFDRSVERYAQRGLEDTGRLLVWPQAFGRFLESPLTGVGADNVQTYLPAAGQEVTPHNALLFIALASGVCPLLLFVAYGVQLVTAACRASPAVDRDSVFLRPLLLYAFLIAMNLNAAFMLPWMMVVCARTSVGALFARARPARSEERWTARVRGRPRAGVVPAHRPL